jgi:hypothetical protein
MDTLRRTISDERPPQNPPRSITCPSCGAHLEIKNPDGQATLLSPPPAVGWRARIGGSPVAQPKSILWITFFSVISALWGLVFSDLWTTMPSHDRYHVLARIFAVLNLPLDSLLLVTSIALLTPQRAWGRKWIVLWSVAAFALQTVSLLTTVLLISPTATTQDIPSDLVDALPVIGGTAGEMVSYDATFAWLSILFLSSWIYWTLTRKKILPYFEPHHAAGQPKIS